MTGNPIAVFDADMAAPAMHTLCAGRAALFSSRCPGSEGANEDSASILEPSNVSLVLAVADGMGGSAAGAEASKAALKQLQKSVAQSSNNGKILRTAILDGFERANEAVRAIGVGAGTTLAVVEIQDNKMRPYHVGDSAILLVGNRGKIKHQSIAHSPIGYGVEAGLIEEDDAMHHEDRHIVSNFVGTPDMHIQIGPTVPLAQRDTLLIASDGLTDNLLLDEMVGRIRKGPIEKAGKSLAKDAATRMTDPQKDAPSKPDDLTFILFRRGRAD